MVNLRSELAKISRQNEELQATVIMLREVMEKGAERGKERS